MSRSTAVIEEFDTEGRLIKRTTETWDDDPAPTVLPSPSDVPNPGFRPWVPGWEVTSDGTFYDAEGRARGGIIRSADIPVRLHG